MKKILSAFLAAILLTSASLPAFAADVPSQKEEVVYGILNTDGGVNQIYVVNSFLGGEIVDYGDYTAVKNLTTSEALTLNGDKITVATVADRLYYQGTMTSKELPWQFTVTYHLDGKQLPAEELGGKSGKLEIRISVVQNDKINDTFFKNYALQISLKLDTDLCEGIVADGATIADAGSAKQISYTVLPGNNAEFSVTADVHDFEMDAISINGIRLVLSFDSADITQQISQLTDAVRQLDNGAGELLSGTKKLAAGMEDYLIGLKAFQNGIGQMTSGIGGLSDGAASLRDGLSVLSGQGDALAAGALAIQQATFDAVNAQIAQTGLSLPTLTPDNYSAVLGAVPQLAAAKAQLDGAVQFTEGLQSYTDGVSQLSAGAGALADGAAQLQGSAPTLASSAGQLYQAGAQLNTAIKQLRDGIAAYKDGTEELRGKTADAGAEEQIGSILDGISGGDEAVVSFVSEKNTHVDAVQFVLKTAAIERPAAAPTEDSTPVQLTFWQKLLRLFGWD